MTEKKPPAAGRERRDAMDRTTPWLDWAVELQAMAQDLMERVRLLGEGVE